MEIDASRKGKKDQEPEAVKKLRGLADELEKDMPDENELVRGLDDIILMEPLSFTSTDVALCIYKNNENA